MDYLGGWFTRWKANECKAALLASGKRSQMGRNKVIVQQKKIETEIAACLSQGREEKARIKAENLIHLQKQETAYDILETLMELIQTRIAYISESRSCPPDLEMPIATVIYASRRLQIPEFKTAQKQFAAKYGASFVRSHQDNASGQVAPNLVNVLLVVQAKEGEVHDVLTYIANKHNVEWTAPEKTQAERNKNAQPLIDVVAPVAIVQPPPPSLPFKYNDAPVTMPEQPPAEAPAKSPKADELELPPSPPSPVNDPQYNDLMERLRRLKLTDDTKPSI